MSSYNVYISSTYRDLASYRIMVMSSLHKVPTINVIGMEYYTAEDIQPLDRCLRDVANCNIYMLILANRYGYIPEGYDKSITHLEFLKAKEFNKIILVFKADTRDDRFLPDVDEPDQPSAAEKKSKLNDLKEEVSKTYLSHPEGFVTEYQLALQVMESLIRSPKVNFKGDDAISPVRAIFCDRAIQVFEFSELTQEGVPFNVFIIQGNADEVGGNLVKRLCIDKLSQLEVVDFNYQDYLIFPVYQKFRRAFLYGLGQTLMPNEPILLQHVTDLLGHLKDKGISALALCSSLSDAIQWQKGYEFLNSIFAEFTQAVAEFNDFRIFWFIVIDEANALTNVLEEDKQSARIRTASPLTKIEKIHVKTWLKTYVAKDDEAVLSIQELYFPDTIFKTNMSTAEKALKGFIKDFNSRRERNNTKLLEIIP